MNFLWDIVTDTISDGLHLLPFLFLTYLAMEWLERRTEEKTAEWVERAGRFGPFIGGALGAFPQCGFSAAASSLYAARVITLGTLLSIYLSTSDEMVPLFVSHNIPVEIMLQILAMKACVGMLCGFVVDSVVRGQRGRYGNAEPLRINELCASEECHCMDENSVWKSALVHTINIFIFILLVTFALNLIVGLFGEDKLSALLKGGPLLGHFIAGFIGLIPNCAASVVITELYLSGVLTFGTMMSGLLVGAGVGLLVLYRVNAHRRQNLFITGLLYLMGVTWGIIIDLFGITF